MEYSKEELIKAEQKGYELKCRNCGKVIIIPHGSMSRKSLDIKFNTNGSHVQIVCDCINFSEIDC
jgi:uncharacterized Zn finger protein